MDTNTKQMIDDLFQRLQQAEKQNSNRDREAESLIEKHVVAQPSAPYYMAQTMIMQEATMKQLHAQVETLQRQLQQAQQQQSGGFFSNLFGGNKQQPNNQWQQGQQRAPFGQPNNGYGQEGGYNNYAPNGGGYNRGSSFLGGALQTAAGVAGGVVLGNLMMDMFSHHQPEEIVNIINENPDMGNMDGGFGDNMNDADFMNSGFDNSGFDNSSMDNGFGTGGFADTGFDPSNNDNLFGGDNFGGGDDPFSGGFGGGFDGGGFDDFDDIS